MEEKIDNLQSSHDSFRVDVLAEIRSLSKDVHSFIEKAPDKFALRSEYLELKKQVQVTEDRTWETRIRMAGWGSIIVAAAAFIFKTVL